MLKKRSRLSVEHLESRRLLFADFASVFAIPNAAPVETPVQDEAAPVEVAPVPSSPYQNTLNNFDVDGNGLVSLVDSIVAVNAINKRVDLATDPASQAAAVHYDVNGDGTLDLVDVVAGVNAMNRDRSGPQLLAGAAQIDGGNVVIGSVEDPLGVTSVSITGSNGASQTIELSETGSFSAELGIAQVGNSFQLTATDGAGHATTQTYVLDTIAEVGIPFWSMTSESGYTASGLEGEAAPEPTPQIIRLEGETGMNAPVVTSVTSSALAVGETAPGSTVTVSGTFTDMDMMDTHTVNVNWGDGTNSNATITPISAGNWSFSATHVYPNAGFYQNNVSVTDNTMLVGTGQTATFISGVAIVNTPGFGNLLHIVGSSSHDHGWVYPVGSSQFAVSVVGGGQHFYQVYSNAQVNGINALGGAGHDYFHVAPHFTLPTFLLGGDGNDHLFGGSGVDFLLGGNGNDFLFGRGGNDNLSGDGGRDHIFGGDGNDNINDAGISSFGDTPDVGLNDPNYFFGEGGNDAITGAGGNDHLFGGQGNDMISGVRGNDFIFGGLGTDALSGGDGNDHLFGGLGNDALNGNAGNDFLFGELGDDALDGGADIDWLFGGPGNDMLTNGERTFP